MTEGLYLFLACWLLAMVEIQIEGSHGWAEKLPTWRLDGPLVRRLMNGKPLTGYHLYLTAFLVAMFHLPLVLTGWSRALEAKVLSMYFLTTITWDFQWFVWNPAWGARRFFRDKVWWFPSRFLGLPAEYYLGTAYSLLAVALLWPRGMRWWSGLFLTMLGASILFAAARAYWSEPVRAR